MDFDDLDNYVKQGITEEEIQQNCEYFQNHPLFMKEIPENFHKNQLVQALQNIVYDDNDENIAQLQNDKANKILKEHLNDKNNDYWLKTALKLYDDGIAQDCKDPKLISRMHSNRALINFKRKNYGKVIDDCLISIKNDPMFLKPYYRISQAYFLLSNFQQALQYINIGHSLDVNNQEIIDLKKKITEEYNKIQNKQSEIQKQQNIQLTEIQKICKKYNINLTKKSTEVPQAKDIEMEVVHEEHFSTPVLIFYPQFQNSDFIQRTLETDQLSLHLSQLFPLPWDQDGYYIIENLVCFVEIIKKGQNIFKRINHNQTILQILQTKNYKVPMMLQIYVLSFKSPFFKIFLENSQVEK